MALRGLLLLLFTSCYALAAAPTYTQCEDLTNCSARCIPEHWRRQLCVFYAELQEWRATAVQCGLVDVPEIVWDRSQPASMQWDTARLSWQSLLQTWRLVTLESPSTAGSGTEGSSSGSLDLLSDDVNDVEAMGDGEMGVTGDRVTVWREEQDEWASDFQSWKTLVEDAVSEGAGPNIDPSDLWMENLSEWSDSFSQYNTTFYQVCTTAPVL